MIDTLVAYQSQIKSSEIISQIGVPKKTFHFNDFTSTIKC